MWHTCNPDVEGQLLSLKEVGELGKLVWRDVTNAGLE